MSFSGYAAQETAAAAEAKRPPQFKNGRRNREAQRKIWFGYVDDGTAAPAARHTYTNRLEGKGIYWRQDNDIEILEFYVTIAYSNFIELTRFGGEMTVCAPTDYIMVNDHQFIYSRIECEFSGTFTLQIVNLFDLTQKGGTPGSERKGRAGVLPVHRQGRNHRADRQFRGVRQQFRNPRSTSHIPTSGNLRGHD